MGRGRRLARVLTALAVAAALVRVGYERGRRDGERSGHETGYAKAAQMWPIPRRLYRSDKDWREAVRQAEAR